MSKKQKKVLFRIIISFAALVVCGIVSYIFDGMPSWGQLLMYLVPYLIIGYDILKKAGKGILNRQVFDEVALGEYREGAAVMLFYQIGELFQSIAVGRSRRNIAALMDIRPDCAYIERDGEIAEVDPDEVEVGSEIVVRPGERIPIDGIIYDGKTTLNTAALTGESLPADAKAGDEVHSGSINLTGLIRIKTRKFHKPFCEILYSGRVRRCACARVGRAACKDYVRNVPGMGQLGDAGTYVPRNKLPVRVGHKYSVKLLCGNRRSERKGRAYKGLKLS